MQYLSVAIEGGVMQSGPSASVWHVNAAQERDDDLSTAQSLVSGRDVQRSLPVLIPRVNIGRMPDQHADRLLEVWEIIWLNTPVEQIQSTSKVHPGLKEHVLWVDL